MASHIYPPGERPDVEVLVDGTWWPGELRGWWDRDGERVLDVQWHTGPGETYIGGVGVERVRLESGEAQVRRARRR